MPSYFPLSAANPLPRLFNAPFGVSAPSASEVEESERKRKEMEMLERNAVEASALPQVQGSPVPAGPQSLPAGIPNPGPLTQRFGISRALLGDRNPEPQGSTETERYQNFLKQGPPRQGILSGLASVFAPRLTAAFTDTYGEQRERLAESAKQEQDQQALDMRERYYDAMDRQSQSREGAARIGADARMYGADRQAETAAMRAQTDLLKASLGADGRLLPEAEAVKLAGDPDIVITPTAQPGFYLVRSTVERVAADKFEGGEKPKQAMLDQRSREKSAADLERDVKTTGMTQAGAMDRARLAAETSKENTESRNKTAKEIAETRGKGKKGSFADRIAGATPPASPQKTQGDDAFGAAEKALRGKRPGSRVTLKQGDETRTFFVDKNGKVLEES